MCPTVALALALALALPPAEPQLTPHPSPGRLQPDTVMYGTAMSAANAGEQWGRTLELLDQLTVRGLTPSQQCYSEALVACREAGLWNAAAQLHARLLLAIPSDAARQTAKIWRGVAAGPNQDATLSYNAIFDAVPPGASREDRARVFAAAREARRPSPSPSPQAQAQAQAQAQPQPQPQPQP